MNETFETFLRHATTAEQCENAKALVCQIAADMGESDKEDARELWRALNAKQSELAKREALCTETCHFCKGSKVAYSFTDSIGQKSAMPEQEYDFLDGKGTPIYCPMCKGVGRIKPRTDGEKMGGLLREMSAGGASVRRNRRHG